MIAAPGQRFSTPASFLRRLSMTMGIGSAPRGRHLLHNSRSNFLRTAQRTRTPTSATAMSTIIQDRFRVLPPPGSGLLGRGVEPVERLAVVLEAVKVHPHQPSDALGDPYPLRADL